MVELDDEVFDAATAVMGCAPAYLALAVEAIADAGAEDGLDRGAGPGAGRRDGRWHRRAAAQRHPAALREAVASPGGSTEAGLAALEEEDVPEAFEAAVRASLERMRGT